MIDSFCLALIDSTNQAVGRLDHRNIVRASDAGQVGGKRFLMMEYVDGYDLGELLDRRGPLPIAEACHMVRQAAAGVDQRGAGLGAGESKIQNRPVPCSWRRYRQTGLAEKPRNFF